MTVRRVGAGPPVTVTHADRVMFPRIGVTKGDVIAYYRAVARWMLPLIKDRPLSVQRFPNGIAAQGFVQQDVEHSDPPAGVDRVTVPREAGGSVSHVIANHAETLAWLANRRTVAMRKADRGGRLYVDVMRNGYAQTMVAPYSIRALPTAPVATPIAWDEFDDPLLRSDRYTIATVLDRLRSMANPWAGLRRHARSLPAARSRLAALAG